MSATVTGTVLTVVGLKNAPLAANATTTRAAAATAATNANLKGRFGGQLAECRTHVAPVLIHLELLLRVEGPLALLEGLGDLSPLPAPRAAQPVERRVRSGTVQPRRGVLCGRGVKPVEVDEDFLRHVLGLIRVGEDAVGDSHDACIFGCET